MRTILRAGLAILALVQLGTGAWQQFWPRGFYDLFPTVDLAPPYSEHLMRDFGGANTALGIVIAAAAVWMLLRVVVVVLAAYLAFAIPHLLFHLAHLHGAAAADIAFQAVALGAAVVLPIALLALAPRALASRPAAE